MPHTYLYSTDLVPTRAYCFHHHLHPPSTRALFSVSAVFNFAQYIVKHLRVIEEFRLCRSGPCEVNQTPYSSTLASFLLTARLWVIRPLIGMGRVIQYIQLRSQHRAKLAGHQWRRSPTCTCPGYVTAAMSRSLKVACAPSMRAAKLQSDSRLLSEYFLAWPSPGE